MVQRGFFLNPKEEQPYMIVDPTLTKSEIKAKIITVSAQMEESANVGDSITSASARVDYNNRYNNFKNQLEQLYSMKANLVARREW